MKKNKVIILAVITLMALAIIIFYSKAIIPSDENKILAPLGEEEQKVSIAIDTANGTPINFISNFQAGTTVFDLLKQAAQEINLAMEIKEYDFGVLIETIGDKTNGQDGKYWLYYVNHEMPMVSADNYKLNPGDKVEFKFEISTF